MSSFALQLRAFAAAVRRIEADRAAVAGSPADRPSAAPRATAVATSGTLPDVSAHSAIGNMELIDQIYEMAGLGRRPGAAA